MFEKINSIADAMMGANSNPDCTVSSAISFKNESGWAPKAAECSESEVLTIQSALSSIFTPELLIFFAAIIVVFFLAAGAACVALEWADARAAKKLFEMTNKFRENTDT